MFVRLCSMALAATLALTGCGAPRVANAQAPELAAALDHRALTTRWQDEVIYFALLDRFNDGDRQNDFNVQPNHPSAYHGGDLQGLIDKLPYLQDLGITTIWISPPLDNDDDQLASTGMWGYHGYWIKDFNRIDEHVGTLAKAQELVTKAHTRGMKVLLDVVANHAGYSFPTHDPQYQGWFHTYGNIQDWNDQWWLENGSLCGLPDFDQENPAVASFLTNTYLGWAQTLGLDGFRIDAVKHVPVSFWQSFISATHQKRGDSFLTLGEVLNGDPNYVAGYQNRAKFDSLFDFPLYYTFDEVFAKGGSMRKLGDRFAQDGAYADASMLSPFLDNHDVPRFLTRAGGDIGKLKLALACVLTIRGIPMLYYGTECAMAGGDDPDNRRDMTWGAHDDVRGYVHDVLAARRRSSALRHGRQLEMWQDDDVYAYLRQAPDSEAIVILNNDPSSQARTLPLRAECRMTDGTRVIDQISGAAFTVQHHQLTVTVPGKQALILLPAAASSR